MPLPKGLFAQALDFSKSTGSKMSPEQTNRALQKIVNLGTSPESKAYREKLVKGVKDTALLEDSSVERAYAVGSATTDKEFPKDIDILARGKSGEKDAYIADNYRYMGRDTDETEGVDLFLPQTERYSKGGRFLGYSKGKEREDKIKNEMLSEGERYTKTYGENHKWIRLVAIPAAAGLGLIADGDRQEAEAGLVSGLRKLLNTPVTRRGFVKGAIEEGKDLNLLRKSGSTGETFYGVDRGKTGSLSAHGQAGQRGEGYFGLFEEVGGTGPENLKTFKEDYKKYFPDLKEKDIERIHTLAAPEDQSNLQQAGDLLLYKLLSIPGVNKKHILDEIRTEIKVSTEFNRIHPGYKTPKEIKEIEERSLKVFESLGITFTDSGQPRIPKALVKKLEKLADSLQDKVIEGVGEVGTKVAEELGQKQMTRRGFFKGLGLGGGAVGATQLGDEPSSEAAFKPEAVAKAAAALIKDNSKRLKSPNVDKQIMDILNKRSTFAGEKATAIRTPTRVGGIIDSMLRIPQKEYSYFDNLMIKKNIDPIGGTQGDFVTGRSLPNYNQTYPSEIRLDSFAADANTFPHEVTHARQMVTPRLMRFMDELQSHVEKWIKNPWERYWNDPAEVHARRMEVAVGGKGPGEIEQTLYDEIYRNELAKTLQYTEKFLQGKDPTFKARFLKNVAIGGAVMTALQMGPEGSPTEAEAMPRGVYEKAGKLMAEVSRTAKDLIGKETEPGKVIQNVFKGKGAERRLVFEDGTQSIVDKNDVIKLARAFGTKEYETRFLGKEPEGQLSQAIKSMQLHEATAQNKSFLNRSTVRQYTDRYLQDLAQMGKMLPPDTCFVEKGGLLFTMPRFYAEVLEKNGLLNIVKTKKYLDIVNKNKVK
jgi:hypothetical protein